MTPQTMRIELPAAQADDIVVMEDHDRAYYAWKERGVSGRTLIHVDAHIDFGWVPELDMRDIGSDGRSIADLIRERPLVNPFTTPPQKMVTIGNYICPAMRDGLVDAFYWIVPDDSFSLPRGRKHIVSQLMRLMRIKKHPDSRIRVEGERICCRILDRNVVVCTLGGLERMNGPVLLDIDVDFLLTPFIWDDLNPVRKPWIFPEDLHARLSSRIRRIDVLTIAYSVEGGFTPLKYKHFGDEIRCLFSREPSPAAGHRREGLLHEQRGQYAAAQASYEQALRVDPGDASAYYNLARLHADFLNDPDGKSALLYAEAVRRDRTYATRYNNYGIIYLQKNEPRKADAEFCKILRMDPDNAAALAGRGFAALALGRCADAAGFFDRSLAADASYREALFGKALIFFKQAKLELARELFLKLSEALPSGPQTYWWLGRIAHKCRDTQQAIRCYKEAVMQGGDGPLVHLILAYLYLTKRFYLRAFEEARRSFHLMRVLR